MVPREQHPVFVGTAKPKRDSFGAPWVLREISRGEISLKAFATNCPWSYAAGPGTLDAPGPTLLELEFLRAVARSENRAKALPEPS